MKPLIAITIGDPAGVVPEIVVKSLNKSMIYDKVRPLVIGSRKVLERVAAAVDNKMAFRSVSDPKDGLYTYGTIDVLDMDNVALEDAAFGQISVPAAQAAYGYIKKSIELAMNKEVDGVATAPIQKEAIHRAGIPYIGHTEMFKGLTHSDHALTMFHVNKMRIFFLTRHLSLVKACEYVTYDHVLEYIRDCAKAMKQLGLGDGRMALAALNPHGGEKGLCGDEEEIALKPAALQAQKEGINVFGPIPADSVFRLFELDKCEAVLSLYHDQGHIAAKVHDLLKTVSVTVGLPFIRTSVDHGTAFDIAGKGIVSSKSMEESILVTGMYIDLVRKSEQAK